MHWHGLYAPHALRSVRHKLICRPQSIREVVLEEILYRFFGFEIVPKPIELYQFIMNGLCVIVFHLQWEGLLRLVQSILILYRLLYTFNRLIDKPSEILMIQVKGILVGCLFSRVLQTVILLQMEYLLNEEKYLDEPVLATLPLCEFILQFELACVWAHERVENSCQE